MVSAIVRTVELAQVASQLNNVSKVAQLSQNLSRIAQVANLNKVIVSAAAMERLASSTVQLNSLTDLQNLRGLSVTSDNGVLRLVAGNEAGRQISELSGSEALDYINTMAKVLQSTRSAGELLAKVAGDNKPKEAKSPSETEQ